MKRDMELVRKISIDLSEGKGKTTFRSSSREDLEYMYHLEIMRQANLISYKENKFKGGMTLLEVPKLTWQGNDYVDAISNDGIWNKTKDVIKQKGIKLSEIPLDLVIDIAKVQVKSMFGME